MSLEEALNANTEALKAHTAALLGQAAPAKSAKADAPKSEKKAETTKPAAKEPAADVIDYETQVKPRVLALVKSKGREVVDGLLAESFEVKSAKELKPEQYASFLEKLTKLEGEEDVA